MNTILPKNKLSPKTIENINRWLDEPKYAQYKPELEMMIQGGDWQQLEDAFFMEIEFGTGGRRGKTGIGSNRINKVTIGESAQALCEYALLLDKDSSSKGIVIAYDTRLTSKELSRFAAQVVAANGFKVYLFDNFRSTPELSFAVRHLGCAAGIVISASHNPPSDNGFKVYWSDGGQLVAPHDKGVLQMASKVVEVKSLDYDEAVSSDKIIMISQDVDRAYVAAASSEAMGSDRDVNIVYSPLHGTGITNVLPVLRSVGFNNISEVAAQMVPDGNFPTIENGKPNPEEQSANDMAVAQLMSESADIAITNDPDADRIGVMVRQDDKLIYLNGNQTAVLATDYTLKKLSDKNQLTSNHYVVKTIVTTDMISALTSHYGATLYGNLLIGFKYIGELILKKEKTDEIFVIGCEESYGLLKGDYCRDKDAATGALPLAEYAAELKREGKTLYDRLLELYEQHGLYAERLDTMYCLGSTGFEKMQNIMSNLRKSMPKKVADYDVTAVLDYESLERIDTVTGVKTKIDCQSGNVFVLEFGDARKRITIRPSGTEPKLKFYIQWFEDVDELRTVSEHYLDLDKHLGELSIELEKLLASL